MEKLFYKPDLSIHGWMQPAELMWLFEQAGEMKSIVEVGSWMGRSTHALCSGCAGTVYAVDHFLGSENERETTQALVQELDIFERFVAHVGRFENLCIMKGESHKIGATFAPKSVDMVFIDGDHTLEGVRTDSRIWGPVAKKLLCGHDWNEASVRQAVEELSLPHVTGPGALWAIRMTAR
jgi:hypothetical protein